MTQFCLIGPHLPAPLIPHTLSFLSAQDICKAAASCGALRFAADSPRLWAQVMCSTFGPVVSAGAGTKQRVVQLTRKWREKVASEDEGSWWVRSLQWAHDLGLSVLCRRHAMFHQADLDCPFGLSGIVPLEALANDNSLDLIRLLIECKADLHAPTSYAWSLLHSAADQRMLHVAEILLQHRANVNLPTLYDGSPPLRFAAANPNNRSLIQLLLDHQANVNVVSQDKSSALMDAAFNGDDEACELLMAAKADPSLRDDEDMSAADFANAKKFHTLAQKLRCKPLQ